MSNHKTRKYDILCVGELLVDCVSDENIEEISAIKSFTRYQGGSPANLSLNMAKLGHQAKLIACVGDDDNGDFLMERIQHIGLDSTHVKRSRLPSSLIYIIQSNSFSKFKPYRGADTQISEEQLNESLLRDVTIFHTSSFALSKNPARHHILSAAQKAHEAGCQLSIDLNYIDKIWQDKTKAKEIIATYCALGTLIKLSEEDWERLYEKPVLSHEEVINYFVALGAKEVCLTLGAEGCVVGDDKNHFHLPLRNNEILESSTLSDAFWAGYLTAWLDGLSFEQKSKAAQKMVELKLVALNNASTNGFSKEAIYQDF